MRTDRQREERMMLRNVWLTCLSVALGFTAYAVRADVWDPGTTNDNGTATQNELVHGTTQLHDLATQAGPVADQDWFKIGQPPYSAWEILVDSLSANAALQINLDLIASDGTTVVQSSVATSGLGFTRSLRFVNATGSPISNQYVRVRSTSCSTSCTASDVYQIRAFETTYAVSRFNNSGTQTTSLIIQNKSASTVTGTVAFWDGAGALLTTIPLGYPGSQINAKSSMVTGLAGISCSPPACPSGSLSGLTGSITVASNGRMADLSGKAVALEAATGFTFETPMELRPR